MNADKIVDYTLRNASKLTPEKIKALASLVGALGGEVEQEANKVPGEVIESNEIGQHSPIDMSDVTGVQVDDGKPQKVQIIPEK